MTPKKADRCIRCAEYGFVRAGYKINEFSALRFYMPKEIHDEVWCVNCRTTWLDGFHYGMTHVTLTASQRDVQ